MKNSANGPVTIRAVEPEDLEIIYRWENDPALWHLGNTLTPFSRYEIKQFIKNGQSDIYHNRQVRFMIDVSETKHALVRTIGSIDLFDYDPFHQRAGVGILIYQPLDRGLGLASQALFLLEKYAFRSLQLHQLYCTIAENNFDSLKLFQKHGFRITGKRTDWLKISNGFIPEYFLQLLATEWKAG